MQEEIVYIELNNWFPKDDYPDEEPFLFWMNPWNKDTKEYELPIFEDIQWLKDNKLCVVRSIIDMSLNYCITAPKSWVEKNCNRILCPEFKKFIREPDEEGKVFGRWGNEFVEYKEENFGLFVDIEEKDKNDEWFWRRERETVSISKCDI